MDRNTAATLWALLGSEGKASTDPILARASLQEYTVGMDDWLERLSRSYLQDLCQRAAHFKLVIGQYGSGKTHFLMALANRAATDGFVSSYIACSAGTSFEKPLPLYVEFVKNIVLPDSDECGIRGLVRKAIENKRMMISTSAPDPEAALARWITKESRDEFYQEHSFGRVMAELLRSEAIGQQSSRDDAALRWLQGEVRTLTKDELTDLRLARPAKADEDRLGRDLLLSLLKFIPKTGANGTVLLLDEVEDLFSVGRKRLAKLLAAMRVLIDLPTGVRGGVPLLGVFAATPEIDDKLPDYQALYQRLSAVGASFASGNSASPRIYLSELGRQDELLYDIGCRLMTIGSLATGVSCSTAIQRRNCRALADVASDRDLEVSARRLFIKTWVAVLNLQFQNGERELSDKELYDRYTGTYEEMSRRPTANEDDEP